MRNKKQKLIILTLLAPALLLGQVSWAKTVTKSGVCSGAKNPAAEIMCLQTTNNILRLQIENAKAVKDLNAAVRPHGSAENKIEKRMLPLPSVLSIYGGAKLTAVLEWRNTNGKMAGSMPTRVGSIIPGGWAVKSITPSTVTIKSGTKIEVLLMSAPGSSRSKSNIQLSPQQPEAQSPEVQQIAPGMAFPPGPFPQPQFNPMSK